MSRIQSAPGCVKLARALLGVYANRGAAHFPKAKKLALMVKYKEPSQAAKADYERIISD